MPMPTSLEVWFTGDMPRVVGDSMFLQVDANMPASVICIINATAAKPCEIFIIS